jgi:hypothetical protein
VLQFVIVPEGTKISVLVPRLRTCGAIIPLPHTS